MRKVASIGEDQDNSVLKTPGTPVDEGSKTCGSEC
ncbi:Uncharacterised protein [Mycobacterium xenopi]|uniref:Uncharacterized protein n=1 Tax=Mycobacterium xenopi TaxID=1789 RepID=A0AAD1H3H2_MYCXE|nr:hypothetical protein MYXE_35010 [Mycobacterium xenopi]SPX89343.1 Uncharacterised protein [Mycobacterium xenopi]